MEKIVIITYDSYGTMLEFEGVSPKWPNGWQTLCSLGFLYYPLARYWQAGLSVEPWFIESATGLKTVVR